MTLDTAVVVLGGIGLLAYVVRGITGAASAIVFNALFGVALAVGLTGGLTLLDGLYWIALADLLAGLVMLFLLRRELRLERFVLRLLATLIPVAVLFTLLLPRVEVQVLAAGLALVLIASGAYLTLRRRLGVWDERTLTRRAVPTGVAAGALSGLYGMAGPVVLVYLAQAGPETGRFRARATVIASTLSSVRGLTLLASGAIGVESLSRFAVTAPVVLVGLGLGMWIHPKVGPRAFRTGLGVIVIGAGAVLLARTLAL